MIPLRDENPTRTTPYVTILLIIINAIVFLLDRAGAQNGIGALAGLAMVPREVLTGQDIVHATPVPVWMTLFTSMFMHANLLHIGSNMLYLWVFGNNIEDVVGKFRFVLFYFAGGLAAGLAHIISAVTAADARAALIPTVGASGAIAAVLGAYLVLFPKARVICLIFLGFFITTAAIPAIFVLGMWIVTQLISVSVIGGTGTGGGGGVAYWAHIGGFIAGIVLILLLGGRNLIRGQSRYSRRYYDDL